MEEKIIMGLVGILGTLFTGGAMFWAKSVHGTLKDIHHDIRVMIRLQTRTEVTLEETVKRVDRIEQAVLERNQSTDAAREIRRI
jgi:hypothetical protein